MSLAGGALASFFLLSPGDLSARSQPRTRAEELAGCRFLRVRGVQDDGSRIGRRQFSATAIVDLELVIGLPEGLTGEHRLDVKVYTPDDHLYRLVTIAAYVPEAAVSRNSGGDGERPRARRKLEAIAQPLDVQVAERLRWPSRGSVLRARLPVAGTSIVASSLYGRWSAVAYLDGSTESCVAPREFLLRE